MLRRERRPRYQEDQEDDEFETPALREAAGQNIEEAQPARRVRPADNSDSDVDSLCESGLGSAEDDLDEDALLGEQSSDNDDEDKKDEDDDSDAPEDVSQKSRQEAEQNRAMNIMQSLRKTQEEQKEKRRKKDTLFKLQKKEKLAALQKRKLPEEFLEELAADSSSSASKKNKLAESCADAKKKDGEEDDEDDLSDDGESLPNIDFIPFTAGAQGSVVAMKKGRREKDSSAAPDLTQLKRNMLYGGRNKRVSNQRMRQVWEKKGARR